MEAFLALLRDNPVMPTAAQIAERAGYSVRSIFERFPDLDALRVATADYSLAQSAALAPPRNVDGDRQTRIKSQVETRAGTCERGIAKSRRRELARRRITKNPAKKRRPQRMRPK